MLNHKMLFESIPHLIKKNSVRGLRTVSSIQKKKASRSSIPIPVSAFEGQVKGASWLQCVRLCACVVLPGGDIRSRTFMLSVSVPV